MLPEVYSWLLQTCNVEPFTVVKTGFLRVIVMRVRFGTIYNILKTWKTPIEEY